MDVLESFSQSYHQSRGAGYDPASWRVIALLVGWGWRWWLLAWLMRGSGIGSSFIGLINSRLFNFPWFGDGRISVVLFLCSYIVPVDILTPNIKLGNMQYLILKILLILYFTGLFKYGTAILEVIPFG